MILSRLKQPREESHGPMHQPWTAEPPSSHGHESDSQQHRDRIGSANATSTVESVRDSGPAVPDSLDNQLASDRSLVISPNDDGAEDL